MRKRTYVLVASAALVILLAVILFIPSIGGVETAPPDFQCCTTTTTVVGNQTRTLTMVATPPTYSSDVSPSYCFWGYGGLLQNGNYYPWAMSKLQNLGAYCPTP